MKTSRNNPSGQHARFLEAAREAGADVGTDAADRLMGRLARMPPEPKPSMVDVTQEKATVADAKRLIRRTKQRIADVQSVAADTQHAVRLSRSKLKPKA